MFRRTLVMFMLIITLNNLLYAQGFRRSQRIVSVSRSSHQAVRPSVPSPLTTTLENGKLLSFGSRMDIRVRLPTRSSKLAEQFMEQPHLLVESVFDSSRCIRLGDETYLLKFAQIPIPGIDVVSPEIEVDFMYRNGSIVMQSKRWALKGNIVKDSKFTNSFNIKLAGQLMVESNPTSGVILTVGWVDYQVQGEKPGVLKSAPSFILDGTINFIQSCVEDFVTKQFSSRLLSSFKQYSSQTVNTTGSQSHGLMSGNL